MINISVVCVGSLKDSFYREANAEYEKRMSPYCTFKTIETTDEKLMSCLSAKAYKIAMCVEGTELSSEEFASKIEYVTAHGKNEIQFIIGGFDGLKDEIKKACDFKMSFSKMTFPHRLFRVFLTEQIYRAFTIINHQNYHH